MPTPTATCPNCKTSQRAELERDENGDYPALETDPCGAPGCEVRLCPNCRKFECDGCGAVCCEAHKTTLAGEDFCPTCWAEILDEAEQAADECRCVCVGDQADASDCPRHGGRRAA